MRTEIKTLVDKVKNPTDINSYTRTALMEEIIPIRGAIMSACFRRRHSPLERMFFIPSWMEWGDSKKKVLEKDITKDECGIKTRIKAERVRGTQSRDILTMDVVYEGGKISGLARIFIKPQKGIQREAYWLKEPDGKFHLAQVVDGYGNVYNSNAEEVSKHPMFAQSRIPRSDIWVDDVYELKPQQKNVSQLAAPIALITT